MAWVRYNPNPDGLSTGDCTVRAVCAVTGLSWDTVHDALCAMSGIMRDMPSENRVWWAFLRGIGCKQVHLIDRCPDCYTVEDFAAEHPDGAYILGPNQHAVAVIGGDWWDTWDSGKTVPIYYFEYSGGMTNGMESAGVFPGELSAVSDAAGAADDGAANAADADG